MGTMDTIRLAIARRNARITDNFTDFDRLHSGRVSREQFHRCLKITGVADALTPQEVEDVLNAFAVPGQPDRVDYKHFLDEVDAGDAPADQLSPSRGIGKTLAKEEEITLGRMYDFFRQRIAATGLDLRQLFKDHDRHHCGKVTAAQFERCFPFLVEHRLMDAIRRKYADSRGDISYACWCADVLEEPLGDGTIRFRAGSPKGGDGIARGRDASALVEELRNHLATNRLRCDDFLRDYDRLNSGVVTDAQFCAALGRVRLVRLQLTDGDFAGLCERYRIVDKAGSAKVDYRQFLSEVAPHNQPAPIVSLNRTATQPLCMKDEKLCDAVVERIRAAIATRRMNLRPTFHDFDQAQKGIFRSHTCTRARFERALAINKLEIAPAEVTLLISRYTTSGQDINYMAFCDDVEGNVRDGVYEDPTATATSPTTTSPYKASAGASSGSGAVDLDAVLHTIRTVVLHRRIRLAEFLRDNDPLRSGVVPTARFCSVLTSNNIHLGAAALAALQAHYASDRVPGYIDAEAFLADIDTGVRVEHPADVPADLGTAVMRRAAAEASAKKEAAAGNNTAQLNMILKRIAEDVRARGVLLPPFFKDYDRHRCGRITKTQFHQTLSRHRMPTTDADISLLLAFYEDPADALMVRYLDFVGDVDESENVALQLTQRRAVRKLGQSFGGSQDGSTAAADSASLDAIIQKIADFVLRRNVRFEEFFKDGDALRHGTLPNSRFRHAIDIVGTGLTEAELSVLERVYASTKVPGSVAYPELLAAVRAAAPVAQVPSMAADRKHQRSEVEERLLDCIIEKVQRAFGSRRVASRQVLQDYDKLHKGRVTEAHFFTALLSVGLSLTPTENNTLKKAYAAGDGGMYYGEFCARVDSLLNLQQ